MVVIMMVCFGYIINISKKATRLPVIYSVRGLDHRHDDRLDYRLDSRLDTRLEPGLDDGLDPGLDSGLDAGLDLLH